MVSYSSVNSLVKGVDDNGPTRNPSNDIICEGEAPPTLEEIRSWGKSFDQLMKSPAGRKVFRDFLRCEYSEENILFWLACEELKRESNPDAVEERARFIYEDYISILSPKEVSLDSRVREVVNRNMVEPTPHTFDEAQLQIYTLMHRDSYPRFVNSPLFKTLAQLNNGNSGCSSTTAVVGSVTGTGGGAEGSLMTDGESASTKVLAEPASSSIHAESTPTTDGESASTKVLAEPASSSIRAESTPTTSTTPSRTKSMTPSRAPIGSPSAKETVSQTEVSVFIFDMTSGGTESMTTTTTTMPVSRVIETISTCNESAALDINHPPDNISVCSDSSAAQKRVDTATTSSEPSESTTITTTITTTTATIATEHGDDLNVNRVATTSSEQSTQSASPTVQAVAVLTTPQKINDSASG